MHHVKSAIIRLVILLLCLVTPTAAYTENTFDYTDFDRIPVMHEGRIKPLGRVAELTYRALAIPSVSGAEMIDTSSWLASLLFDPQGADTPRIFYLDNAHLVHVLNVPNDRAEPFYSFRELNDAFTARADLVVSLRDKSDTELQNDQRDLLDLYARVTFYEQLKNALTRVLPLKNHDGKAFYQLSADDIQGNTALQLLAAQGELNQSLRIIPVYDGLTSTTWLAPWQIRKTALAAEPTTLLDHWHKAAQAYISADHGTWNSSMRMIRETTTAHAQQHGEEPALPIRLETELLYHALSPYYASMLLYAAALFFSVLLLYRARMPAFIVPCLLPLAWAGFLPGLAVHSIGLLCRMVILQRPPVSNLYESILFVGVVLMTTGLVYAWRKREWFYLPALGVLGVLLHLFGFALNDEGDSLQVLQAVLDTKFWLATHVIIITTGYALCLLTSLLAHIALLGHVRAGQFAVLHSHRFFKRSFYFSLLSLLFISVGTLLGGVWADQSWGRFWGWDPKENGALLIILWLVWLQHGRISKHISDTGFTIGLCLLSLVVGVSWIGVNLLGIGLHSYGFLNGSAISLLVLFAVELVFFAAYAALSARQKRIKRTTDA